MAIPPHPLALQVEGVGKTYRLWPTPASRLWVPALYRAAALLPAAMSAGLRAWLARRVHEHHALQSVSFELARGEALGIIGHNGSGKSTLLQIIAGVLTPSEGRVVVHGRVAALLELGSGFNPELTGRENARINAAILGMSVDQIEERLPNILAFADIGDYVDEPVKTYSSGMALRLAFAVQVHTQPDILIVDEALAVGDAAFQAKAMAKIDEILSNGATLLFVGHDLNAVKAFCHRAMLLEKGRIRMAGLPDEVITEYLHGIHRQALSTQRPGLAKQAASTGDGYAFGGMAVRSAALNGTDAHASLRFNDEVALRFVVERVPEVANPGLIIDVLDGKGLQLTGRRVVLPPGQTPIIVTLSFRASLQMGVYRIRLRLVDAPSLEQTVVLARREGILSFDVIDDSRAQFTGLFPVPMEIEVGE